MDESLENTFGITTNKGNDRNGASNKDEFHNNHYRHITNEISNERSASVLNKMNSSHTTRKY